MAKNPHVIRKFKVSNSIDSKEVNIGRIMQNSLLDQLQLCTATSSLQNLFANPTASFKIFCTSLSTQIQEHQSGSNDRGLKRPFEDRGLKRPFEDARTKRILPAKTETRGSIVNTTGKKINFPRGLEKSIVLIFWIPIGAVVTKSVILFMLFIQVVLPTKTNLLWRLTSRKLKESH